MKIDNHEDFVVLADEKGEIESFASFLEYQVPNKFKGQNVILDLLEFDRMNLQQLLLFLKVSNLHRKTRQSFVIINNALLPDDIPEEMIVVPTLQEAADIIEMENIERDLGF